MEDQGVLDKDDDEDDVPDLCGSTDSSDSDSSDSDSDDDTVSDDGERGMQEERNRERRK